MNPASLRRGAVAAALFAGATLCTSIAAQAAEAILFDGNNCTGQYRMLDRSVGNFDQIGFDNRVNSLMVITGAFRFYRDANYGEGNGPSFQLGPSGYTETCWSLADAAQGNFPNDRMSSAQLLQDSQGPQPQGVAIVYDFANFGGQYRILTRNVADFNAIGFDNDVESIRVVSGTWTFYRDANYGQGNGQAITLGPGDYANVNNVPGYQPGTFPGDRMSAAQVQAGNAPPPPPQQCAPGQIAANNQCLNCWDYFGNPPNSSQLNAAGDQCECAPGFEWSSFGAANIGGVIFRNCLPAQQTPPPPNCPGPYQVLNPGTNQCVFNCHQSTQPNPQTGQCDCLPGTQEAGFLNDGRRYCLGTAQPQLPQVIRYTAPGNQLIPTAQGAGFTFTTQVDQGGAVCQVNGNTIIFQMTNLPDNKARTCIVTMFGGRQLAYGWQYEDYNMSQVYGQATPIGSTTAFPFQIRLIIPPFGDKVIAQIVSVDLLGPAGQSWQAALQ
ncbi:MAG: beta/gamma crystallin-related protein [Alphaproteobacteria bacterium]